jgi:L-lactate dehydrogenase
MHKRILGIIGAGHVGSHIAYAAGMLDAADIVKICDINEIAAASQVQDLNDAVKFMPGKVHYESAGYPELGDCGIIINTAGKTSMSAENRDNELIFTARLIISCMKKVQASGFSGVFINVANPCDVITQVISESGILPEGHVFGTGTSLDSARLTDYLSQLTGLDHNSFDGLVMGEHGDSQMIPWSHIDFMGQPFEKAAREFGIHIDREQARKHILDTARRIYKGKGCTEFGIGAVAASIARAVFADDKKIFMLSAPLHGEYGHTGICAGVPAVVGQNGIEKVLEYDLTEEEREQFNQSCEKIRQGVCRAHELMKE